MDRGRPHTVRPVRPRLALDKFKVLTTALVNVKPAPRRVTWPMLNGLPGEDAEERGRRAGPPVHGSFVAFISRLEKKSLEVARTAAGVTERKRQEFCQQAYRGTCLASCR